MLLVLSAGSAQAQEPRAPKLGELAPPPAAAASDPPARALPRTQVICLDRAGRRCWSGERVEDCTADRGEVFAELPVQGGDPGARLRACWDALR